MNVKSESEAIVTCMGMIGGGGRMHEQEKIKWEEAMKATGNLKNGKAAGEDGITAEMLKYGGETVLEWMHKICGLAREEGRVPRDWTKAIIISVYKGKCSRNECGNYKGISLLSIVGKVYGKIVIERMQKIIEDGVSEEQGGFRKGWGCVDQIFSFRMTVEKILTKGKKIYAAFIDPEKAYDRTNWTAMWYVLKVYDVGGSLMNGVKAFYNDAKACIMVNGENGESFRIQRELKQGSVMSPWFFNSYVDGVIREMKTKVGEVGMEMRVNDGKWIQLNAVLSDDDTVLIAENESDLQKLVNVFNSVCKRRKLKANINKSKVMVFEKSKSEVVDFACPYRLGVDCPKEYEI